MPCARAFSSDFIQQGLTLGYLMKKTVRFDCIWCWLSPGIFSAEHRGLLGSYHKRLDDVMM